MTVKVLRRGDLLGHVPDWWKWAAWAAAACLALLLAVSVASGVVG